ncbi:MAG: ESPR domain-containing protein, partial [Burkholderiales bacterium]|nr:ESPR domain-containing protein [Burkholderiales bacterium]
MNKTYKSVYCHATQSWVAVSETTKAKGKTSVKSNILSTVSDIKTGATTFAVASVGALFLLASPVSHALEIGSNFINNTGTAASAANPGDVAIGGGATTGGTG